MERDQLLEALSAEFYTERARRRAGENVQPELSSHDVPHQQQANRVEAKLEPFENESCVPKEENLSQSDEDGSDGTTVKSEITSSDPSVIIIDSDSDELSEGEKERELIKYKRLEKQALQMLQRIRDGMNALNEKGKKIKPRRKPLAVLSQAGMSSRVPSETIKRDNKKMKADEAWEKALRAPLPGTPQRARDNVLLSLTFQNVSKAYLAEHSQYEEQLGPSPTRMENGTVVSFANSTLEIRGRPSSENRFDLISVRDRFHIDLSPISMTINDEILVTDDVVMVPKYPDLGALPKHVITLIGPAQTVVRMEFKQRRYLLTFDDGKPKVTKEDE